MGIGRPSRARIVAVVGSLSLAIVGATAATAGSPPPTTTGTAPPTTAGAPPAPTSTEAPDTSFLRAQAEAAFAEAFPDATGIACATPPADEVGVEFPCYGRGADGAVLARTAAVNDDGGIDFAEAAAPSGSTTAPPTTLPPPVTGSGNGQAAVGAVNGPTIVAVTHGGTGPFVLQPQRGGVATGAPVVNSTGAVDGRFLAGLDGAVDSFAVTADGDWTVQVQPAATALPLTADTPAAGAGPDVVRISTTDPAEATIAHDGDGPFTATAVTSTGSVAVASHSGPYQTSVTLPAGPGFLVVGASGAWTVSLGAAPSADTAVG